MEMTTESRYSIYKFAGKRITANDLKKVKAFFDNTPYDDNHYKVYMDADDIIRIESIDTMGTMRRIEFYYYNEDCELVDDNFRVWTWYQTKEERQNELAPKHASSLSKWELSAVVEVQKYFGILS